MRDAAVLLVIPARPQVYMTTTDDGIRIEATDLNENRAETVEIFLPWCDVSKVANALLAAVKANEQKDAL